MIDLNVLLDVMQKREPHYRASAAVVETVLERRVEGVLAAHAVTTLHYLVSRYRDTEVADDAVNWLLRHFTVASVGVEQLRRAQGLGWKDFEDAVVAAAAESFGCRIIVTRNVKDFRASPIDARTPDEYLLISDSLR